MKKILSLLTLALCTLTSVGANAADLKIVAAENFYGGVAQQVAGGDATVTSILTNPNQDPHEFTSNAATAKAVADADIVIYSGISYDPWMDKLLATGGKPGRVVIKVSDLIDAKEGDNPHIWYDPRTMPALATKLSDEMIKLDANQANVFAKHSADFIASMKLEHELIAEIKIEANGIPVTATEPVFGYMCDALGFKMLNYDSEPTAAQTAAFEKSLTSKDVKILFYNSQVTDPTTERMQQIAKKAGIPVMGVTETQPPDQKTYQAWMVTQLLEVKAYLAMVKIKTQ